MLSRIVSWRVPILVAYALLVPLAAVRAARIPSQGGLDRLIVPSDPDFAATRAFQRIFPDSPSVLLLFESDDPWAPASLARVEGVERELRAVPRVGAFSVLDAIRRARPGAGPEELRRLATGTQFFRKQGLVGDRFLAVIANLDVRAPRGRARRDSQSRRGSGRPRALASGRTACRSPAGATPPARLRDARGGSHRAPRMRPPEAPRGAPVRPLRRAPGWQAPKGHPIRRGAAPRENRERCAGRRGSPRSRDRSARSAGRALPATECARRGPPPAERAARTPPGWGRARKRYATASGPGGRSPLEAYRAFT